MEMNSEEKSKLYSFFKNIDRKSISDYKKNANNKVLIVDGNNLFLRSFSAVPTMDTNGNHIGGVVASLKSLGYAIKLLCPTRCIVVFDGVGGSYKRRKIYPEYKEGRKGKIRLNRQYEEMGDVNSEDESCKKQYVRFMDYLRCLPVNILSIDHNEADDVISYLATDYFKESDKIVIMSADKDFLQLCSPKVSVYSPTKKLIYGEAEVLNEYKIHPNNYVLYRAMDGDNSDNINGIEGAGPKTIVKHFPFLNEDKIHIVDDLINHASYNKGKYKIYDRVIENRNILERNVALMQLKETLLTTIAQLHCNECLETSKIPKLNRGGFANFVREDCMSNSFPNYINWINEVFSSLDSVVRNVQ